MKAGEERIRFETRLYRPGGVGTSTFARCPFPLAQAFGAAGQIPVAGTINGVAFRGTLMPWGDGTHFLTVDKRLREAASAGTGDLVVVECSLDSEPRTVEVPEELAAKLSADGEASSAWASLAPSHRKEYASWISGAKKAETRVSRAAKAVIMLWEGKKLK